MAKKIEFELPDGLSIPEGVEDGDEFDALATIQLKSGGKGCLVALDDYRMPGYKQDDKPENDNKSYSQAASEGMPESY